ncbi:MAG: hypothetical protein M9893_11370 [Pyrinomonadaceae bacterium]|nr:hypothetical protein [Pyrinomonadaceae bacterium]
MRSIKSNIIFVLSVVLALSVTTAMAANNDKKPKAPKNMGTLSVNTSPVPYKVRIDGEERGVSGVDKGAEFYLTPGFHTVEVIAPNGQVWKQEVEIRRGFKNCICLKSVEETITKPCPYRFHLEGPDRVTEGDAVTFKAIPDIASPIPVIYNWRTTNGSILTGQGTPNITVDSNGLGGRTIEAELDVNDSVYDGRCRQVINVPTDVERLPPPETPKKVACDQFETRSADDDKARFDNCVIMSQNTPDSHLYVIIYPGTDRISTTRNTYERVQKRTLDYMVRNRGYDPSRIHFIKGSSRLKTSYEVWIVPAGAEPPVAQ